MQADVLIIGAGPAGILQQWRCSEGSHKKIVAVKRARRLAAALPQGDDEGVRKLQALLPYYHGFSGAGAF